MAAGLLLEPEWGETIEVMRALGAKGTDEQFERVLRHLLGTQTQGQREHGDRGADCPCAGHQ